MQLKGKGRTLWHMLPPGWTLKTLRSVREASLSKTNIWFLPCDIPRAAVSLETEGPAHSLELGRVKISYMWNVGVLGYLDLLPAATCAPLQRSTPVCPSPDCQATLSDDRQQGRPKKKEEREGNRKPVVKPTIHSSIGSPSQSDKKKK